MSDEKFMALCGLIAFAILVICLTISDVAKAL